jgi:DNA-binding transcriptional LysR family regulator
MVSGVHEKLAEQLRFKELDVIVSPMATTQLDLVSLESLDVPVNLIFAADNHILSMKDELNPSLFFKMLNEKRPVCWVMPNQGSKLRSEINRFFEDNDIKGRIVFESDVTESLTRSVVDNVGIAFLPLIYVSKEIEGKSAYTFGPQEGYWSHRLWLSGHLNSSDDILLKSLAESFKEVCNPLLLKHIEIKKGEEAS